MEKPEINPTGYTEYQIVAFNMYVAVDSDGRQYSSPKQALDALSKQGYTVINMIDFRGELVWTLSRWVNYE
jgi:hypothetical protein